MVLMPQIASREDIVKLIGLICILLSAKYLEKTYPGVERLNRILGAESVFTYEDYIAMERHVLQTLDWQMLMVTH